MSRKDRIKRIIRTADFPPSTNQIADELGVDWHTANADLEEMQAAGTIVKRERQSNLTEWHLNR